MDVISSKDDIQKANFWIACCAELIGTAFLVIFACGTCLHAHDDAKVLTVALGFGFSVTTMVVTFCRVSGGHINPAVTIGFACVRRISVLRGVFYILFQCIGAIMGAGILYAVTPETIRGSLCTSVLAPEVTLGQGFVIELIITFSFVLSIFALVDPRRTDVTDSVSITIGFSITLCHLWAVPFTGAAMNPARLLGSALVSNTWNDHWLYWVGDLLGGILAGFLYEWIFAAGSCPGKIRAFFTSNYHSQMDFEKNTTSVVSVTS